MPESNWSPWQPTEADLILARTVYADRARDEFAFEGLSGVEALVAAFENSDWLTVRRVVRTMRAYMDVAAETKVVKAKPRAVEEIVADLLADVTEISTRGVQADAA